MTETTHSFQRVDLPTQVETLHLNAVFSDNAELDTVTSIDVSFGSRDENILDQRYGSFLINKDKSTVHS